MDAREAVFSGELWDQFCEGLKQAGRTILRPEAPATELDRAEGWRYLSRLIRIALEWHLEFADADFPSFFMPSHETGKIGADNPDNLYLMARINGAHAYVIEGTRGTVHYLSFGTQKGGYERDGKLEQTGFLDHHALVTDADGRFEIVVSAERPAQCANWLRIEPASNAVLVRQTFLDRRSEQPARLTIRRCDTDQRPAPLDAARIAQGLLRAAGFVQNTAALFADWAQGYLAHVNQLPPADQAVCQRAGGDPNIFYYHSAWQLAPDEALVIHIARMPECRFWNLQINNWWMESLDYRYHRVHFNQHTVNRDADGGITLVLAHRDPGHPNWLETAGHTRGTMCMRWVAAKEHVHPTTRLVRLDDFIREARR
ncbi:Protein of unknown function [Fontimonas thermophila]|uniref:DUF1214 domain-containing protein n=1 Tax=Fontimonas thermophila TaxID=1076937 RepID=A0A1I2HAN4_9GAMM|nr:DUF1214 domain-containing protein [Fontimonas thermophila]SFF26722.1 Protein of unknown function [Fontimonas thermophila]